MHCTPKYFNLFNATKKKKRSKWALSQSIIIDNITQLSKKKRLNHRFEHLYILQLKNCMNCELRNDVRNTEKFGLLQT